MKQTLDIEEIKEKLYAKLEPSGWAIKLRGFIFSKEFDDILKKLIKQTQDGKRFTPTLKNWFRAFEECPYNELKVVIVAADPYSGLHQADGIPFSLSLSEEKGETLNYLLNSIDRTVYDGNNLVGRDRDLKRWSNQGILMVNSALTTTVGKSGQHYIIWQTFLAYLFDFLTWYCPGLVYIYMGKQAQQWHDAVNDNNYKFMITHPALMLFNNDTEWDCGETFKKTTEIIKQNYNYLIQW
jgi:uracil-DNA glycosylase